jgi:MoaA/NifB/PqqE/SkfB family radical SAM enzyme
MKTKKIFKTVMLVGYTCNNKCVFCNQSDRRNNFSDRDTKSILAEIVKAKKKGTKYLELIGGECTIRPDILKIVAFASKQGFKEIKMATNGRMLSYPEFAKEICKAGITELIFSIHGHNSRIHDRLTGSPGSFKQLLKGIENLRKLGFNSINSNTTIVRQNHKYLVDIGKLLLKLKISDSEFIFVDCNEGGAYHNYDYLVPKISEAAPHMNALMALGKKNGIRGWHLRYVPLCYFRDHLDCISEIVENMVFYTEHVAPEFISENVLEKRKQIARMKPPVCNGCKLFDRCEGLWRNYLKHYGQKELKPVK